MASIAELSRLAGAQIAAALARSPLSGLGAVPAAGNPMAEAPSNVTGAHLRNAYWLAVASRIARGHGDGYSAASLLATAQTELAQGAGSRLLDPSTWLSFNDQNVYRIQLTLQEGENAVRSAAPEVAAVLSRLRRGDAIAAAQAAAPAGWIPDWIPLVAGGGYATAMALVAGGILLFFTWPYLTAWGSRLLGLEATRRIAVGKD